MIRFYSVLLCVVLLFSTQIAQAAIMLTGGYTHDYLLAPGAQARGMLSVRNTGRQTAEVKIYLSETQNAAKKGRSNLGWVSLSSNRLSIPPGATKTVRYIIKTPASNSLRGTYWGALMIEPVKGRAIESQQRPTDGSKKTIRFTINQVIRHSVTLITNFSGGKANVRFSQPKMVFDHKTKKRTFSLLAQNSGTAWVGKGTRSWIDLYNTQGVLVGRFKGEDKGLLPSTSKRYNVDVSRLKPGAYKGLFAIAPANGQMFGADVNVNIK